MTTITNSLEASEKIIQVANQLGDVINGTSTEVVATDSGDIPTVRKALVDSMLIKDPLLWGEGSDEVDPLQPRTFTDGIIYWAPNATSLTPIPMGATPLGDSNWKIAPVNANNVIDTLVDNQGEWDNTKEVKKGQIWGYKGSEWRSLTGVSGVAPVEGVNWRKIIDQKDITTGQEELINGAIFPSDGAVEVGDAVPVGTTHLRVLIGGKPTVVAMSPIVSGVVSSLTDTGAVIADENVTFVTQNSPAFIGAPLISKRFVDEPYLNDYSGDRTSALQRMIDENPGRRVNYHDNTIIEAPIDLKSQTILRGAGNGGSKSKLIANFDQDTPIPSVATGTWNPNGLSFAPMIYNSSAIQWWGLENVALDCNNSDYAYGLYLNENFYGGIDGLKISNAKRRPLTMIRSQNIGVDALTLYNCLATSIIFDYGILNIDNLGLEIIGARDSLIICTNQGNNKGMCTLGTVWAEHKDDLKPTRSHLTVSGRNMEIHNGWFTGDSGSNPYDGLWCVDGAETVAFDNINGGSPITLEPARNIDANINYQQEMGLHIGGGTSGRIRGYFNPTRVVNNSGLDTVVQNFLAGQRGMSFNGSFNVYDAATAVGQPTSATDRTFSAENQVIKMIKDKLNIKEVGVNVEMDVKTAALTLRADSGINIVPTGGNLITRGYPQSTDGVGLVLGTAFADTSSPDSNGNYPLKIKA